MANHEKNTAGKILMLPLKCIKPNPDQPRKYFDPGAMDDLTRSIERYGVLSPITVRRTYSDSYELISGERRYRAAYNAGLDEIPCIVLDADSSDCAILSLLENLQREDLSFLEIAESYRSLVKKRGITSRELSKRIGDNRSRIRDRIKLMRLDPMVRKYIRSFGLTERQAKTLLRIHDRQTQIDAARQICENDLCEAESIRFISELMRTGSAPTVHINKIRNLKILRNTVTDAISIVRKSGINAELKENSYDWGKEFIIIIRD